MSNGQRAPQVSGCVNGVLADPRAYFFSLIGRTEGSPAPDWKAVLESLPGRGMGINPKPGERQPLNAPHYGITVMIDAGNNARGRIWLPTDLPVDARRQCVVHPRDSGDCGRSDAWLNGLGVERQGRSTVRPAAVSAGRQRQRDAAPQHGAGTGGGAAQEGDMVIDLRPLEARIQALEELVSAQAQEIADLKSAARGIAIAGGGALPKKIALKTDHGTYVTAEPDGRMTNREDHPAAWQTLKVEAIG